MCGIVLFVRLFLVPLEYRGSSVLDSFGDLLRWEDFSDYFVSESFQSLFETGIVSGI